MTRRDLPSSPRYARDGKEFWRDDKAQSQRDKNGQNESAEKDKDGDSVVCVREMLARAAAASAARIAATAAASKER